MPRPWWNIGALDLVNFFLADVRGAFGPYLRRRNPAYQASLRLSRSSQCSPHELVGEQATC